MKLVSFIFKHKSVVLFNTYSNALNHIQIQCNLSYQTLQIKDTIEKTSIIRTKILVPTDVTNPFFNMSWSLMCVIF